MTSAQFKQRQEAQSESDRFAAFSSELQDVVGGKEAVENPLGLLSGLLGDGSSGGLLAIQFENEVYSIAPKGKVNIIEDERAAAPLGVKFREQFAKLCVKFSRVFLSHGAATLVVFGPPARVKNSTPPVTVHEFIKEHVCTVLCAIRNLTGHSFSSPVRSWFFSSPPETTVTISPFNVKFPPGDSPGKGSEILERAG
jgi:hypothetical protein